jgi:hypothetical protein
LLLFTKFLVFLAVLIAIKPLNAQATGVEGGFEGGVPGYDGPSILGRTGPGAGKRGTENVPINWQASLNGSYDSNLLGYAVDSTGTFRQQTSLGVNAMIGVSGRKRWRRSYLGVDYAGDYNYYTRQTLFNGSNHQLNLSFATQAGRSWQVDSQVAGGTSNRFVGNQGIFQTSELEFLAAPTSDIFDSRNYFIGNTTSATYLISSRQTVRFSGTGSSVRRRAPGLIDMQSYGAASDWVYRLNRRTSTGVSYYFTHFDFSKVFGESDVHTVGWHISRRINRDLVFSGSLTGSQQSTVGVRSVVLDPVLAAILGRAIGAEVFESNNLLYGYSAALTRRIRRSSASINALRSITPGNGYFLTSLNEGVNADFTHEVSPEMTVGATVGYSKLTSLGFTSGSFRGWTAGVNTTYRLTEGFGLNARYDWRTFDLSQTAFGRSGYRVTVGVTYFPTHGPGGLF